MQILVLCGDYWHPCEVVRAGLEALDDEELAFDWVTSTAGWSADALGDYPVVVLAKSDRMSPEDERKWLTPAVRRALADYVRGGGGLLVLHAGTVGYREMPELFELIGGVFVEHPPQCPVTVDPAPDHPLAAGVQSFRVQDEHYMMEMADVDVDVFLTSRSEHGDQPAGWTRTPGEGRVCVLTPGHTEAVMVHPQFQTLLRNALRWCGAC